MDSSDQDAVRRAVEEDRQSKDRAREAWQKASGKRASRLMFKSFLFSTVQDISV